MLRIGLDISMLARLHTGVENYIRALAEHLPSADTDLGFSYFSASPLGAAFEGARVICGSARSYALWRQAQLPRLLREHRIDLLHSPITALPLTWNGPIVSTIHDVIWSKFPETYSFRRRTAHRVWCQLSARKAARVIVPSQATARDLSALIPEKLRAKIAIVALPTRSIRKSDAEPETKGELLRSLNILSPFVLAVGTVQPHKNYLRLIEAFERLPSLGVHDHQLVIVGADGFRAERIREAARKSPRSKAIRLVGYLESRQMFALYRMATACVYPSLYEGFGLPVLEAMAMGSPVAASRTSSMPEVGGDAACYFDPENVDEMSQVLCRLLSDESLRAQLVQRGRERVKLFTPQRMASDTIALYRRVLEQRL